MTDPIPPELVFMPEDVMRIILENCDFVSIQTLRNTCHNIRNFIDLTKPSYHFKFIRIQGHSQEMSMVFSEEKPGQLLFPDGQQFHMSYRKINEEITEFRWGRRDKECMRIIGNSNFFDMFTRDLGSILDRNSTVLDRMIIAIGDDRQRYVQRVLASCEKPLTKVHELLIPFVNCQEDVLGILQYICPDTTKSLSISSYGLPRWDISRILKLDHWKKTQKMVMGGTTVRVGIENYEHFESANAHFEVVTMDDLNRVKENFLNSPSTTKSLFLHYNYFHDHDLLVESFGQPNPNPDGMVQEKSWFFRRSDNFVLFIHTSYYLFVFEIKTLGDVPEGAEVIG